MSKCYGAGPLVHSTDNVNLNCTVGRGFLLLQCSSPGAEWAWTQTEGREYRPDQDVGTDMCGHRTSTTDRWDDTCCEVEGSWQLGVCLNYSPPPPQDHSRQVLVR